MKKKLALYSTLTMVAMLTVSCSNKTPEAIKVTSIEISADSEEIFVGDKLQFTAVVKPENATDKSLIWNSSTSAASIDQNGLVTGASSGITVITAKSKDGLVSNSFTLTVKTYRPVRSVEFAKESETIKAAGGFAYSDVIITPTNATNKDLDFKSSNESVASVDDNGMITGHTAGSCTITVTSEADPSKKDTLDVTVTDGTWNNYEKVDATKKYDFQDLQKASVYNLNAIPATGNVRCLVIPFEFQDYPFNETILTDLDRLFNGKGAEDTGYWESISSYYDKSSYGNVNLTFEIADVYKSGLKASETTGGGTKSIELGTKALNNYKSTTGSKGTEFDSDKDGYIDAVYYVYSAPDYQKVKSLDNDLFWAFCYWKQHQSSPSLTNPDFNVFMWASYDFMYAQGNTKVDGHTFIHETGHLFGANDYYNYNSSSNQKPLGKIDMMDWNVGDHNSYTKMAYGWSDPLYVTGDAKITISPAQLQQDNFILINEDWNHTAFDEYLLLELSTPYNLNKLDSEKNYTASTPKVYTEPGIKMYHVDSRLAKFEGRQLVYSVPDTLPAESGYEIPAANSDFAERNDTPELFYEIGLIQSGKKATMLESGTSGSNEDLFHTGDYFRMADYQDFFYEKQPLLNSKDSSGNRKKLNYQIYFENVDANGATLVIQHVED